MRSQQIPSHLSYVNEKRERQANFRSGAMFEVKAERVQRIATALVAMNCVSKTDTGYLVTMPRIGQYQMSFNITSNYACDCTQTERCEHSLAAELYAAKIESEDAAFLEMCAESNVKPIHRVELDPEEDAELNRRFNEKVLGVRFAQQENDDFYLNQEGRIDEVELEESWKIAA